MTRPILFLLLAAVWMPAVALAQADSAADAAVRAEFVGALETVESGAEPLAWSPDLRRYRLFPYLQAQQLRMPIRFVRPTDDAAIDALLKRDGDAPWTRDLRRDWLLDLARRQQWPMFLAHYLESRTNAELGCAYLNARIATTTGSPAELATLQPVLLATWATGRSLPDACDPALDWAQQRGWLTAQQYSRRAELALKAGNSNLANYLLRKLPADAEPALRRWAALITSPDSELAALAAGGAAALKAAPAQGIADAVSQLSHRAPDLAAPRVAALAQACGEPCALATPATIGELRREVALGFAWSRLPESVGAFRAVDPVALDDRGHEWRVRAALWSGDWALVRRWIDGMPATLGSDPRWRYWSARARAATGDGDGARAIYGPLARENGFYALLAAHQLGQPYTPTSTRIGADPAVQQRLLKDPALLRARELWLAGRSEWSSAEWIEFVATLNDSELRQAAQLPGQWDAWLHAVVAASRARVYDDYELLYPRPYEPDVAHAAALASVPEQWVYAVMRQESLYDPRARSSASALGLLQLLPSTARETARSAGLAAPKADDLYVPAINTRIGALHLRELLDRYDNEFVLVLGAYNAGPRPVARWRPNGAALDADVWIENVPYNETRSYIQRVIWHSAVFGWLATGQAQSASPLLKPITSAP